MKGSIKVILLWLILFSIILSADTLASADVEVVINGEYVQFDVNPRIIENRTMVPLRKIFESIGANVVWIEELHKIQAYNSSYMVELLIGSNIMTVNGNKVEMDVCPVIIDNRTFIPARYVAEAFGAKVDWETQSSTVLITTNNNFIWQTFIDEYEILSDTYVETLKKHREYPEDVFISKKILELSSEVQIWTQKGEILYKDNQIDNSQINNYLKLYVRILEKIATAEQLGNQDYKSYYDQIIGVDEVEKAKNIFESEKLSKCSAENRLLENGYTAGETEYIVDKCNISWEESAEALAKKISEDEFPVSKDYIRESLAKQYMFTYEEAECAIDNISWKEHALEFAKMTIKNDPNIEEWELRDDLGLRGFNESEVDYAISGIRSNTSKMNTTITPEEYAYNLAIEKKFNINDIIWELVENGCEYEMAVQYADNCGVDWTIEAVKYIEEISYKYEETYSICSNCDFESDDFHNACPVCEGDISTEKFFNIDEEEILQDLIVYGFSYERSMEAIEKYKRQNSLAIK